MKILRFNFVLIVSLLPTATLIYVKYPHRDFVIQYYSLIYLLANLICFDNTDFQEKIKNNRIIKDILTPRYIDKYGMLMQMYSIIPRSLFAISLILLVNNPIIGIIHMLNVWEILIWILLLLISLFNSFYIYMIISFLFFWIENTEILEIIRNQIIYLMAGVYFPVFLWSRKLSDIFYYLPTSYLYIHPMNFLFTKKIHYEVILVGFVWIFILNRVVNLLVKFGNLHYQNKKR